MRALQTIVHVLLHVHVTNPLNFASCARRRGIARRLVAACAEATRCAPCNATSLALHVGVDNAAACALYAEAGFTTLAEERWNPLAPRKTLYRLAVLDLGRPA